MKTYLICNSHFQSRGSYSTYYIVSAETDKEAFDKAVKDGCFGSISVEEIDISTPYFIKED